MVHVPARELRQYLREAVYHFVVWDTDVVAVFFRRAVFVSTDCGTVGVALSRGSQCRCWGIDEDATASLCHESRCVAVNLVRPAVHAVPTVFSFPGVVLELRHVCFDVYEDVVLR